MKKIVKLFALLLVSVFLTSCGQNQTGIPKDNIKSETTDSTTPQKYKESLAQASLLIAEISKESEAGTIYQSSSPHHNVVHQFTYLVAMRDFCNKTLLQMHANGEVNKKLPKELERELVNSKAELTSSKFNGLKIESGLYEKFLKQINDRFRD